MLQTNRTLLYTYVLPALLNISALTVGAFLAAAMDKESNTCMQQKQELEMMKGKAMVSKASAGRPQRIYCQRTLTGHSREIGALAVTRDGLIVTGSRDNTAKVWTREGECLQTLTLESHQVFFRA